MGDTEDNQGATRGRRGLIRGRWALEGEGSAVEDATAESNGIGIFNLVSYTDAEGEGGDLEVGEPLELAEDVSVGEIAFHGGGEGENHLVDGRLSFGLALADALDEAVNLELLGANAIHRGNKPTEDVIEALELTCGLDGHHFLDVLDHTDGGSITLGIGTDLTEVGVAEVVTALAVTHLLAQTDERFAKVNGSLGLLTKQMEREAKRRLTTNAGQFGELVDGAGQQLRGILFHQYLP